MAAKGPPTKKSPKKKGKPAPAPTRAAGRPATPKAPPRPRLAVLLGDRPLPEDEARALWQEFSRHMDENEGDLAGFAAKKSWKSVKPEHRQGQAVLVVET